MKRILVQIIICFLTFVNCQSSLQAQTIPPPFINYQAVLYDVNGANPNNPLINQSFTTFVNINDELGNLLYREEHYASTDANGLITVKMGDGLYTAGPITNFNQIDWGVGKYYLVVDFDINGTISSTAPEQLVTVPYSFYAGKAGNGMTAVADNGNGTLTFTYANGATYTTPTLAGIQGATGPQGPTGAQGPAGTNGTNGLNALIKTTSEPAGANCANGGTKIETGLDTDGNGTLDAGEVNVSQTGYVCDGQNTGGTIGGYQIISGGSGSFTVPNNISLLFVELYGSGGGGGRGGYSGCGGCGVASGGGGGGSGGYVKRSIQVVPGQVISYIVGVGGVNEQNGSPTIFGSISAPGGIKGGNGQLKSSASPTGTENNGGSGGNAYGFSGAGGKWNIGSGAGGGAGGAGGDAPFLIGVGGLGAGFVANYTNANQGQNGGVASGGGGGGGSVCNSSTGGGCSSPTNPGLGGKGGDGQIIITW